MPTQGDFPSSNSPQNRRLKVGYFPASATRRPRGTQCKSGSAWFRSAPHAAESRTNHFEYLHYFLFSRFSLSAPQFSVFWRQFQLANPSEFVPGARSASFLTLPSSLQPAAKARFDVPESYLKQCAHFAPLFLPEFVLFASRSSASFPDADASAFLRDFSAFPLKKVLFPRLPPLFLPLREAPNRKDRPSKVFHRPTALEVRRFFPSNRQYLVQDAYPANPAHLARTACLSRTSCFLHLPACRPRLRPY